MKKLNKIYPILISAAVLMPLMALAQDPIGSLIGTITTWARALIILFMVLAVAVFLYGVIKYILASGDESARTEAKGYIIYGLIGIFVLVGFMGIIAVVAKYFGVTTGGAISPPTLSF